MKRERNKMRSRLETIVVSGYKPPPPNKIHRKWHQQVQSPTLQNLKFNRHKTTGGNLIQRRSQNGSYS